MSDPRYEVQNAEIETTLKDLGRRIHNAISHHRDPKLCFALLLFEVDTPDSNGCTFYLSDAQRPGAFASLKEAVERMEKQMKR